MKTVITLNQRELDKIIKVISDYFNEPKSEWAYGWYGWVLTKEGRRFLASQAVEDGWEEEAHEDDYRGLVSLNPGIWNVQFPSGGTYHVPSEYIRKATSLDLFHYPIDLYFKVRIIGLEDDASLLSKFCDMSWDWYQQHEE